MRHGPTQSTFTGLVAMASLLAGCAFQEADLGTDGVSLAPYDDEEVGASAEAIINGTAMTGDDQERWGMVSLSVGCSGALYRNDWVLTAAHCFDGNIDNPGAVTIRMNTQSVTADAIIPHPTFDVALVHLASPLLPFGDTSWGRALYGSEVNGLTLHCFGFGWTTNTGGGGFLQSAYLTVSSSDAQSYSLSPNSAGNINWRGDSGGVCLAAERYITGVQSSSTYTYNPTTGAVTGVVGSYQFRASAFATWADRMTGGAGAFNDQFANAYTIPLVRNPFLSAVSPGEMAEELVVGGTTLGATFDGPSSACGCYNGSANVWYRFTLTQREIVYLDTVGSELDTSILVTDAWGTPVPANGSQAVGLCNDDAGCSASSSFSSHLESRTWGVLNAGTYYVGVGGCGHGRFALHLQHVPTSSAASVDENRMSGDSYSYGVTSGTPAANGTCTTAPGPERMHWFVTCGGEAQLFSTCRSDGGNYTRAIGGTYYDSVIYARSASTGKTVICNDDGTSAGATDCSGTGGDTSNYGSRVSYNAPRGLNVVFVDNYNSSQGMQYLLRQIVR